MLEQARDSHFGTAWMSDSQGARALAVRGWASSPSLDSLSFFAPNFSLSQAKPWLVGELAAWSPVRKALPGLMARHEPVRADFVNVHADLMVRIAAGEFSKAVPLVFEDFEYSAPLSAEMFANSLLTSSVYQTSYGFEFENEGLVGVTPEVLFSVKGRDLSTMALAGTAKNDGPSLLENRKELHEHQLVIDHIVTELGAWGRPDVGETIEREYGVLKHLFTPIQMRLKYDIEFMALVGALHPTAALGGWPRSAALNWLQLQKFHVERRRFGAPFGFVDGNEMRCVVAIRGVQWQGSRLLLASGCGVVEGSRADQEWEELALKRRATRRLLGIEL